jgi:O-antigen/teichoic acid export membrane protein
LAGGTVFAQGLIALSLPLLTRLYTPGDFALLAVYMSILGLVTAVACLRLNLAIPLPEDDGESMSLLALALIAAAVMSLGIALLVIFAPDASARLLGQPEMISYLWMIPVGVFLAAVYNALQYWASRKQRFPLITRTRMTRAVGGAATQVGFGIAHPTPFGLLFGHMLYSGLGVLGLVRNIWREDRVVLSSVRPASARAALVRYRRFPLYSVPEALFNTGGIQVPVLLIAAIAAGPEAGFLMLAMQVMGMPMALFGSSVAQVYLAEAPRRRRDGTLGLFTKQAMFGLLKAGGPPLIGIGLLSPVLFPWIFGDSWGRAGNIVAWMTPWFILQFIASPISAVLHVTDNVRVAMVLQAFGFVLRLSIVLIAASCFRGWLVEAYALSGAVFYALYAFVIQKVAKRDG